MRIYECRFSGVLGNLETQVATTLKEVSLACGYYRSQVAWNKVGSRIWSGKKGGIESEAAKKVVGSRILCLDMKVYLINTAYIIGMSPYQCAHGMKSNKYASRQENYKFYEEIRTSSHSAFLYYSKGSKIETVKRYWLIYASFLIDKILKIVKIRMILEEHTHS